VSSFLTAHQHIIGYSVPYNDYRQKVCFRHHGLNQSINTETAYTETWPALYR